MDATTPDTKPDGARQPRWPIWVLLALIVLSGLAVELVTRLGFDRIDTGQRRMVAEYAAVVRLGDDPALGARQMLVVGNSLLLDGVDFPRFVAAMRPEWSATRLAVVDTSFFDWYYCLRRLFRSGARPETVVVTLSPRQLVATSVRGEYFAHYLMNTEDILRVARDVRLSRTSTTNLAVGAFSKFYAAREEIRKWALGKVFPNLPTLTALLTPRAMAPLAEIDTYRTATERLRRLRELGEEHGARMILLTPPISRAGGDAGQDAVLRAGAASGVQVLAPCPAGGLDDSNYRDGFHLNEKGAAAFTSELVQELKAALTQTEPGDRAPAAAEDLSNEADPGGPKD